MAEREPGGGSKPSAKDARQERQARELRQNLARRKKQSRARAARAFVARRHQHTLQRFRMRL